MHIEGPVPSVHSMLWYSCLLVLLGFVVVPMPHCGGHYCRFLQVPTHPKPDSTAFCQLCCPPLLYFQYLAFFHIASWCVCQDFTTHASKNKSHPIAVWSWSMDGVVVFNLACTTVGSLWWWPLITVSQWADKNLDVQQWWEVRTTCCMHAQDCHNNLAKKGRVKFFVFLPVWMLSGLLTCDHNCCGSSFTT